MAVDFCAELSLGHFASNDPWMKIYCNVNVKCELDMFVEFNV